MLFFCRRDLIQQNFDLQHLQWKWWPTQTLLVTLYRSNHSTLSKNLKVFTKLDSCVHLILTFIRHIKTFTQGHITIKDRCKSYFSILILNYYERTRNFDQICHFFVEEVGTIQKRSTKKTQITSPIRNSSKNYPTELQISLLNKKSQASSLCE